MSLILKFKPLAKWFFLLKSLQREQDFVKHLLNSALELPEWNSY